MNIIAEILDLTADRLEKEGWCQGDGFPNGHCILTAAPLSIGRQEALAFLANRLGGDVPLGGHAGFLVKWNDTPGRNETEVLAALREAAQAAREIREDIPVGEK